MAIEQDVADESALAALSVSDGDVTKGKEVRVMSTGDIWRPIRSGVGAALWMKLTALYASATGAIPIAAGTWTPTATVVTNLDSVTTYPSLYARLGTHVFGVMRFDQDATAAAAAEWEASLPVASDFTADANGAGVATSSGAGYGYVGANATTNRLRIISTPTGTSAAAWRAFFMYQVI